MLSLLPGHLRAAGAALRGGRLLRKRTGGQRQLVRTSRGFPLRSPELVHGVTWQPRADHCWSPTVGTKLQGLGPQPSTRPLPQPTDPALRPPPPHTPPFLPAPPTPSDPTPLSDPVFITRSLPSAHGCSPQTPSFPPSLLIIHRPHPSTQTLP